MKKLAIIGTVGLPAKYGGFETLAHHLVLNWKNTFSTSVYCCSKDYPKKARPESWEGARLIYLPCRANGWQSIVYDILSTFHALFYADVLLILGVSGSVVLPLIRLFSKKRILINIDGQEWKRPKWSKWARAFLKFSEKLAVRYSDEVITDNAALQKYVREEYGIESRLITYGGDHVTHQSWGEEEKKYTFQPKDYAFKVARIEPENNIHLILEAFSQLPDKKLVLVGNWEHSTYSKKLRKQYANFSNLFLLNPIYDQKKLDALRSNCRLYVHGHQAGGTNPSLVEAMNLGLPIIAYDVSFNRESMLHQGMYFSNVPQLLARLLNTEDSRLQKYGNTMRKIARSHYNWKLIASQYGALIRGNLSIPSVEKEGLASKAELSKPLGISKYRLYHN